jgi:hypothetical protein
MYGVNIYNVQTLCRGSQNHASVLLDLGGLWFLVTYYILVFQHKYSVPKCMILLFSFPFSLFLLFSTTWADVSFPDYFSLWRSDRLCRVSPSNYWYTCRSNNSSRHLTWTWNRRGGSVRIDEFWMHWSNHAKPKLLFRRHFMTI